MHDYQYQTFKIITLSSQIYLKIKFIIIFYTVKYSYNKMITFSHKPTKASVASEKISMLRAPTEILLLLFY